MRNRIKTMKIQRLSPLSALPSLVLPTLVLVCLALLSLPVFAQDVPEVLRPPKVRKLQWSFLKTCNVRGAV